MSTGHDKLLSPSDARKATALRKMKLVALALLLGAAVLYVVARINQEGSTTWGYVRAFAEAAMVGALADWFAVTALFRYPLGIPIPHTAIIPNRKHELGRSLGEFVETNFMSKEILHERLSGIGVGQRLGDWLSEPANAHRASIAVSDVVRGAIEVIDDNRATFRERLEEESPWWVPNTIDDRIFAKIYDGVSRFLYDVGGDPTHEVRMSIERRVQAFATRLRNDPEMVARGEQFKEELLAHPDFRAWMESLWRGAKSGLIDAASRPDSELHERIASSLRSLGERLRDEPALREKLDRWVAQALGYVIENYRSEVSKLIESTVARWDGESTSRKMELQVGRDLQFIRINGTIVGGLAGVIIHAVGELVLK